MLTIQRSHDPEGIDAIAPLQQARGGLSAPFLVRASDERRYWCKVINNPEHTRIPINEQLVGRLGQVLGAATCEVALIRIPEDLAGWQFCSWNSSLQLEPGWAHGSAEVAGAVETRTMRSRISDDNARRHAGLYAIYDWLCGEDPQWLACGSQQDAFFSHDHGSYFPNGPGWTVDSLRRHGLRSHTLPFTPDGLDPEELARLADRLQAITPEELAAVGSSLPATWPVGDDELKALLDFVQDRRRATAERLRAMIKGR